MKYNERPGYTRHTIYIDTLRFAHSLKHTHNVAQKIRPTKMCPSHMRDYWYALVLNKSAILGILIQSKIFIEKSGPSQIR